MSGLADGLIGGVRAGAAQGARKGEVDEGGRVLLLLLLLLRDGPKVASFDPLVRRRVVGRARRGR